MINFLAQLLGYLAFIFLAISLWVNNDIKFRWVNSFGCLAFVLYGILIHAFPIILTNVVLLAINIYFLFKIYNRQEKFDLVEFEHDAALVNRFLSFYKKDIQSYFPAFKQQNRGEEIQFIILRDVVMANIFIAAVDRHGDAFVQLNYTVPKYRDYKVGRFLFEEGRDFLHSRGIKRIIYEKVENPGHINFLKVIGFKKEAHQNGHRYIKNI